MVINTNYPFIKPFVMVMNLLITDFGSKLYSIFYLQVTGISTPDAPNGTGIFTYMNGLNLW